MVRTVFYDVPPVDRREVLLYAGCRGDESDPAIASLLDECISECGGIFKCGVSFIDTALRTLPGGKTAFLMPEVVLEADSAELSGHLTGCTGAVIFGATVGIGIDRLIMKYSHTQPSKAVMLQAYGAERIEAVCDMFEEDVRRDHKSAVSRFSPGYGDLSLELQKNIASLLELNRNLGIAVNESLLMSPSKSVTAIIGYSDK